MNMTSPINPASGLPMVGDTEAGVDVAGNPFGFDWNSDDSFGGDTLFDHGSDMFSSSTFDWGSSIGSAWD